MRQVLLYIRWPEAIVIALLQLLLMALLGWLIIAALR